MIRRALLVLFALITATFPAHLIARQRVWGWCQQGGQAVTIHGSSSSPLRYQRTYPSCVVKVFNAGTLTLASLNADNSGTPKPNPFTADATGMWFFYPVDGRYDISLTGGGISGTLTYPDVSAGDTGGGGGGSGTVTNTLGPLTLGLPVIGNNGNDIFVGTKSGTTTEFATHIGGHFAGGCLQEDALGNITTLATGCVSGSSGITGPGLTTVNNIVQWNSADGSTVGAGLGFVLSVGAPGLDTNVPSEKAIRAAITAATSGVTGPGATIIGFLPTWGNTLGTSLATGLPVSATPGNSTVLLSDGTGKIASTWLPSLISASTSGNAATSTLSDHTPTLCPSGQAARGVDTSFNGTGCFVAGGGGGGGTVTATINPLVANQVVVGNGGVDIKTSSVSADPSGNINTPGNLTTGSGGTVHGSLCLGELLVNGTSCVGFEGADSLATGLLFGFPNATPTANNIMLLGNFAGGKSAITYVPFSSANLIDSANIVRNNQSNTYTTGAQDFGAAASLRVPVASGATTTTNGRIAYNSTNDQLKTSVASTDQVIPHAATTTPANGNCVTWGANFQLTDSGGPCTAAPSICFVDTQAGADWGAKLNACLIAGAKNIDASRFNTPQAVATSVAWTQSNVYLKGPPVSITLGSGQTGSSQPIILMTGNSNIADLGGAILTGSATSQVLIRVANPGGGVGTPVAPSVDIKEGDRTIVFSAPNYTNLNPVAGGYIIITDTGNSTANHRQVARVLSVNGTTTITIDGAIYDSFYIVAGAGVAKWTPSSSNVVKNFTANCADFAGSVGARFDFTVESTFDNIDAIGCPGSGFNHTDGYGNNFTNLRSIKSGNGSTASFTAVAQTRATINNVKVESRGLASSFNFNLFAVHGSNVSNITIDGGDTSGRGYKMVVSSYNTVNNLNIARVGQDGGVNVGVKLEHSIRHNLFTNVLVASGAKDCAMFSEGVFDNTFVNFKCLYPTGSALENIVQYSRQLDLTGLTITVVDGSGTATFACTAGACSTSGSGWARPSTSQGDYYNTVGGIITFGGFTAGAVGNNDSFVITGISSDGLTITVDDPNNVAASVTGATAITAQMFMPNDRNSFLGGTIAYQRSPGGAPFFNLMGNDWKVKDLTFLDDLGQATAGINFTASGANASSEQYFNKRNLIAGNTFSGLPANTDLVFTDVPKNSNISNNDFGSGVTLTTGASNVFSNNRGTRPTCNAVIRGSDWFVEQTTGADEKRYCVKDGAGVYSWNIP